jgi:hypothetical protein
MTYDELLALKADFTGMDAAQAEQKGRDLYRSLYLDGEAPIGIRALHDTHPVIFHLKGQFGFDHGFFTSSDLIGHPLRKDVLAVDRLERMPWIGPMIRGEVQGVEYRKENFWRAGKLLYKRLYVLPQEGYVVWVEPQARGDWTFATAYTPTASVLAEYRRKALLVKVF